MGENTTLVKSCILQADETSLQPLQEVNVYNQDSNSVCTVILDSSDVTFIPILPVEAGEEVVYYEEVKVEVDDTTDNCDDSNKIFPSQELRSKSIKPRRRVSRHGPHKCGICSKTFSQFVNLVTHERIHTGEKPFQCAICLKCFSQQPNLWKHLRVHTGERPYQCSTCLKRFTQQANLNKHARIHTGERPYICKHCNRRFTQQANLTKHVRTHTGERPFHCRFCSKAFVQQSNLERHQRIHTGVKPFKCHMCNDCFAQNAHLSKHLRSIHKVTEVVHQWKLSIPFEEISKKNGEESKSDAFIDNYSDSTSKKPGIPVLFCTKTGRIIKRVD